jgi:hypothetical protein
MKKMIGISIVTLMIVTSLPVVSSSDENIEDNIYYDLVPDEISVSEDCGCGNYFVSSGFDTNVYWSFDVVEEKVAELKLMKIRRAIKENNADWIADYTSVLNSKFYMQGGGLGCIPEDIDEDDYEDISYVGYIPDVFDWRNVYGMDYTTSVKNQGSCGSCTAFGTISALESVIQIEIGRSFGCDLSEAHLFSCGGGKCDYGMQSSKAFNYLKNNGVTDEECFPYKPHDMPCSEICSNCGHRTVKIGSWSWVPSNSDSIRTAIFQRGPLVTSMKVYEDFHSYSEGIYRHVSGELEGWHCVAIVGYDDNNRYWICKNSWGTWWGESGFFRIAYGQCDIEYQTAYLSGISGNVHPFCPSDPSPYDEEMTVDPDVNLSWFTCEDPDGDDVFYNVYLNEGSGVSFNDIVATHIDTSYFQVENLEKDSLYTWRVVAEDENGAQCKGPTWKFSTRLPCKPDVVGPSSGSINKEHTFTASTTDNEGEKYDWFFDWGDDTNSGWLGPYNPGEEVNASHTWTKRGDYEIWVRYKEDWTMSERTTLEVSMPKNKPSIDAPFTEFLENHPHLFPLLRHMMGV